MSIMQANVTATKILKAENTGTGLLCSTAVGMSQYGSHGITVYGGQ